MSPVIREVPYDSRVSALLLESDLPIDDLPANSQVIFYGVEDGQLQGVVALVGSALSALVRSLAVAPERRGHGIGEALLNHVEAAAATRQFEDLCPASSAFMVKRIVS